MWDDRTRYCKVCGQRLNLLGNCPHGCAQYPAGTPDTPAPATPGLRLVREDPEPQPDEDDA